MGLSRKQRAKHCGLRLGLFITVCVILCLFSCLAEAKTIQLPAMHNRALQDSVNNIAIDIDAITTTLVDHTDTLSSISGNTTAMVDTLSEALHLIGSVDDHNHNPGRSFGKSADQSGDNWMTEASFTLFRAISGNGVYGATDDADTTKVIGSDDTPLYTGAGYDMREVLVVAVSEGTLYYIRFIWHTDNAALGIAANQFTELATLFDTTNPNLAAGISIETFMPDLEAGVKVWAQCANATDNATLDFIVIIQPELH